MKTASITKGQAKDILRQWLDSKVERLIEKVDIIESHQGPGGYFAMSGGYLYEASTEECFVFPIIESNHIGATRTVILSKETGKVLFDGILGE